MSSFKFIANVGLEVLSFMIFEGLGDDINIHIDDTLIVIRVTWNDHERR